MVIRQKKVNMDSAILEKKKKLTERREHLAKTLDIIKNDYSSKNHGDALTIIGPLIDSLATATAAQVIKDGSAPLLLSLRIALQGIESESSKAGVIGKILNTATKGVTDLVIDAYLAKVDVGSKQLFQKLIEVLILCTISVCWYLNQFNLAYGASTGIDEAEDKRKKIFGFELMLLMLLRTGIVQLIVKNAVAACGADDQQQESIAKLMKAILLILALLTTAKGERATLKVLVLDLKNDLIEGLEDIQTFMNKAAEAEKTGENASATSIFVQQAIASLHEDDFDTLVQAYTGALEVIQGKPELLDDEIANVISFAQIIFNAMTQGPLEMNRTTASLMI